MDFGEKHLVLQVVFWGVGMSRAQKHQNYPKHLHWMILWVMGFLSFPKEFDFGYSLFIGIMAFWV